MQEHTTKDQESSRARSSPIHIVPTLRPIGANADALREVHMSLVRAEQNLYNLVQASHPQSPGFGFAAPATFTGGYAAPAFAPGFAPGAPLVAPAGLPVGFANPVTPWSQGSWGQVPSSVLAPWSPLASGIGSLAGPLAREPIAPTAWSLASRTPACDIADEGKHFVCVIDLPGLRADQVELLCSEHTVVINATREPDADAGVLVQAERGTAFQHRTILLPNEIQPAGVKATLANGILTVTLPKLHPTEGPRRVKIQG
ncbi:MAG: Hsp20/alpha crystallin family protein [Candidatus Thermoplasmatota archaeon]